MIANHSKERSDNRQFSMRVLLQVQTERRTFFHGHTFTGSALGCAAALAALAELSSPEFLHRLQTETIPEFWRALERLWVNCAAKP